jgi:alkyl sulfatase BDS1-like metallo-beta-lactamase superfamily hydrolase
MHSHLRNPTIHITTHDATGKATLHSSQNNPPTLYPEHQAALTVVYSTSSMPPNLNGDIDIKLHQETVSSGKLGIVKPNGTVCRFVDFAPGNTAMMHRTQSLDYGVVLEGNVLMELDDGSNTPMTRGDVAVQRATMHAWKNASQTEWARMLFVLQDCQPLIISGQRLKEDLGHGAKAFGSSGNDVE